MSQPSSPSLDLRMRTTRRLPVCLQSEVSECGLACLAMVASFWGLATDLGAMRRRFSVSLKGVSLKSILTLASAMHLGPRALKVPLDRLAAMPTPSILHWNFNHFVVLKRADHRGLVIHDPAVGIRELSWAEASACYTGVAVELRPTGEFRQGDEREDHGLLDLMGRIGGLARSLGQVIALGLALQLCVLAAPFLIQIVIDDALSSGDAHLVLVLGLGFGAIAVLQTVIEAARSWVITTLSSDLNFQWYGNVLRHLLSLPLEYFAKRHQGDVVSRFSAIQTIQRTLTLQFAEGAIDGVLVLATLVVMLAYSVKLTLISSCAVLAYLAGRALLYRRLRQATVEQIIHTAAQQTHLLESINGIQTVRLFHRAEERRMTWLHRLAEQFNAELDLARVTIRQRAANTLLANLDRIGVICVGATMVIDQMVSAGMLLAFLSYREQFAVRCASLVDKVFEFKMIKVHGQRLGDIVFTPPEDLGHEDEVDLDSIEPVLEVRHLTFRYSVAEPDVIRNLSFTIAAGESVAITGASGCGKTTLVKLMLGLLTPTSGEIRVGGFRLEQLGLGNYRKVVSTVMQDDQLFSGSIRDNITFFDPHVDDEHLQACAAMANVHEDIVQMPMRYNTLVGAQGAGLSGGQIQRLLLARALYRRPRILFLDEATSNLDLTNEQHVNAEIDRLALTRVIVAHRPDTINTAHRVIVLANGSLERDLRIRA